MQASRGGAFRGRGRGGFRGRGRPAGAGASGQQHHLDADLDADADGEDVEEAPEIALLRQTYTNSLNTIKSIFPQYTDEEILLTVQEANGQADVAIARIAEGYISTFTAAKPKQQQQSGRREQLPPSQAEQAPTAGFNNAGFAGQTRGAPRGAARGAFTGRGRGGDFRGGRGAARGGRGGFRPPITNGHAAAVDTPEVSTTTTTIETTEADGWGEVTITQTTESADATEVVQTVETIVKEESTPQPAPVAAAPAAPAAKPASRVIQPGAKMSWAQIARPPPQAQPKPAPVAAPAPKEPEAVVEAPVEVVIVAETSPAAAEPTLDSTAISTADIVSALAGETAPLLEKEESTSVSQDPWAPAVPEATTPAALPVGEGWADAVAAAKDDALDIQTVLQHQRAEAAVPPTGVDPAGPLDVHTPAPEALPTQQPAFDQPSALVSESARSQAVPSAVEKLVSPPGLAKRGSARVQQDAPVVISGSGATPSVEGVGVQFGSLSLFGNFDADQNAAAPAEQQQQATSPAVSQQIQLPGQQQQAQQGIQRSLYETPTSLEQKVQEALQPTHQSSFPASTTDHNQFGAYQQSQQQPFGQQSSYGQDRLSGLGGYGGQYQQQQASSIPSQTSAYASRYPQQQQQSPFGQQAQQGQGQQQQAHDPFASLTANANASAYGQQAGGLGNDSISPYYSSTQHNMSLGHQSAPSPAPASARDIGSLGSQAAPGANSGYGGFTSAIGQAQQQQYPNDYASLYGLPQQQQQQQQQEPARVLNQYEQFAQQHGRQIQTGDDSSAKLGSTMQSALGGAPSASQGTPALQSQQQGQQQQQQAQQQQQGYPPNFAPYGYPYHHYYGMPPYGQQQQGYPGYPSHHSPYAPYPGYGPPGGASTNRYPGQQQQQQANGSQGGYRGGYGNASGSVGGAPHQSNYGSYAGFDSSRTSAQGQTNNAQDTRNNSAKDVFGDRYFSGQY